MNNYVDNVNKNLLNIQAGLDILRMVMLSSPAKHKSTQFLMKMSFEKTKNMLDDAYNEAIKNLDEMTELEAVEIILNNKSIHDVLLEAMIEANKENESAATNKDIERLIESLRKKD
jgi:hypothetical protein